MHPGKENSIQDTWETFEPILLEILKPEKFKDASVKSVAISLLSLSGRTFNSYAFTQLSNNLQTKII